jgi:hypothetical protein
MSKSRLVLSYRSSDWGRLVEEHRAPPDGVGRGSLFHNLKSDVEFNASSQLENLDHPIPIRPELLNDALAVLVRDVRLSLTERSKRVPSRRALVEATMTRIQNALSRAKCTKPGELTESALGDLSAVDPMVARAASYAMMNMTYDKGYSYRDVADPAVRGLKSDDDYLRYNFGYAGDDASKVTRSIGRPQIPAQLRKDFARAEAKIEQNLGGAEISYHLVTRRPGDPRIVGYVVMGDASAGNMISQQKIALGLSGTEVADDEGG